VRLQLSKKSGLLRKKVKHWHSETELKTVPFFFFVQTFFEPF